MKSLKRITDASEIVDQEYDVVYYNSTNGSVIIKDEVIPPVETVDLGIVNAEGKKVLWATCNVGANAPEEYGKYFQWGDTVGYEGNEAKAHSTWATAPFNNGSSTYDSTYFTSVKNTVCPDGVLASEYDAATVAYGEGYRMPTEAELGKLKSNTTCKYETFKGIKGIRVTSTIEGYTDKSIFVPFAGDYYNGQSYNQGSYGYLLGSSIYSYDNSQCYIFYSNDGGWNISKIGRSASTTLRAVKIED